MTRGRKCGLFIPRAARAAGAVELSGADFLRGFRVRFGTVQLAHNNTANQDGKDSVLGTSVHCPFKPGASQAPAAMEHRSLLVRPLRTHLPETDRGTDDQQSRVALPALLIDSPRYAPRPYNVPVLEPARSILNASELLPHEAMQSCKTFSRTRS